MNAALILTLPFFAGWALDILIGDPAWMPHPVRLIGLFISNLESVLRGVFPHNPKGERSGGLLLCVLVTLVCLLIPAVLLAFAFSIHLYAWMALETLMTYQILATRSLRGESMSVFKLLINKGEQGDLSRARLALSRIVGRDTGRLNRREIIKAAIETVAESTNDGVIAPMFFLAIGGGAAGMMYKAVNTLDSMVGYKNSKYIYFGMASAKLDDLFNFIPSRLAAALMLVATDILRLDFKNAARIYKRDRFNHDSPNSAQTEAVCAGALNIELGGGAFYGEVFHNKKTIGDDIRPVEEKDIRLANRLMAATSALGMLLFGTLKLLVIYFSLK